MRLDLNDMDLNEVKEILLYRKSFKYTEIYSIDEILLFPNLNYIKVFFYELDIHKLLGDEFRALPEIIPIWEFHQIKRELRITKLGL